MNIIILLGTNMGERLENLTHAKTLMAPYLQIIQESKIYQTAAWGNTDQADF
ncbi:MAG: 7,8-dihydro-6-hydroxymethylpterin-pyrophosphokinae, partial [Bacteroidota bacterium]